MLQALQVNPARDYDEALRRVHAFKSLDDDRVLPQASTTLLTHGSRTPLAVVLFHGFTNHPGQYVQFAPLVHATGANVFVPRLPLQGYKDRLTRALKNLTAEELLASAGEAVDIACGLGERVCLLGISSSGVLCAYFAQHRGDISYAVGVAPVFSMLHLPYRISRALGRAALVLPNRFLWWDPRVKMQQRPITAYPRFPTRALAQTLRISDDVHDASVRQPLRASGITLVCNWHDPAVNNHVSEGVVANWNALRARSAEQFIFTDLPHNHDIIDPDNPRARTDIVYPKLLELIRKA
ncbi:MAG TPA: alpha/beta fold hydrolase [Candidatus Baltobacteraceae bacterium]|jgi:carboxylesterase|nr:alpha/beta fold hydrolase [Candidatus Baltobacteraceae bacterium]